MNYFPLMSSILFQLHVHVLCRTLFTRKTSFSMILFFIISFLDFDKTSTYTKKKIVLHLIYMYVVSIYSKYTAEKESLQSTGRGFKHFRLSQHIFSSPYCFSYNALFFLMDKCTILNMLRGHCTRFLRLFSSTLITLVFNVTCHCSMITQVHNATCRQ